MYPIPPTEHLIETRACRQCDADFPITDKDMEFYSNVSPRFGEKKYLIPPPILCPYCRETIRLSFINQDKLYSRKCDFSGKDIVSRFSPVSPRKVYEDKIWWGDSWDPKSYGCEYSFTQGFFSQYQKLSLSVPVPHTTTLHSENCEYCWIDNSKNCYLCFVGAELEGCLYSTYALGSSYVVDSYNLHYSENCYECTNSDHLFNCQYVHHSEYTRSCAYSFGLINCEECLFSHNLIGKKFYIGNVEYTESAYREEKARILHTFSQNELYKQYEESRKHHILKSSRHINCEDSIGQDLTNCKNCHMITMIGFNSENCRYTFIQHNNTDCIDVSSYSSKNCIEISNGGNISQSGFCYEIRSNCHDVWYSSYLDGCHDCFGCIGLKNAKYVILNRQYTKEEYETMLPRIIENMIDAGEWGTFFPKDISNYPYQDSLAYSYDPLSSEEIKKEGYNYSDYEVPFPKVEKVIPANKLPDTIEGIPDDILNWAIECEVTKKPFRIIREELEFYRKHSLPLPRRHPDQRNLDRMKMRNPRRLIERICENCKKNVLTAYPKERPETVYCEACYTREVIG